MAEPRATAGRWELLDESFDPPRAAYPEPVARGYAFTPPANLEQIRREAEAARDLIERTLP